MDLAGTGNSRPSNIAPSDVARFLAGGFREDPPGTGIFTTTVPLPDGWFVDVARQQIGTGDASSDDGPLYLRGIYHTRPDGLLDSYGPDGTYWSTGHPSRDDFLGTLVKAIILAGVGAGLTSLVGAAQAGAGAGAGIQPVSPAGGIVDTYPDFSSVEFGGGGGQLPVDWTMPEVPGTPAASTVPGITDTTISDLFPQIYEAPPTPALYDIPTVTIEPASAGLGVTIKDAAGVVKEITGATLSVLSTVTAFRNAGKRLQDPATATRSASGSTGLVLTRGANGQLVAQRPGVGVATVTADGGVIVNNGDGTYDYIDSQGNRVRRSYGSSGSTTVGAGGSPLGAIDPKVLLVGGLGLAALLMFSKR
jgi:hypothetical protein